MSNQKKTEKKKKRSSVEAQILKIIEKSMKSALDAAMKDLFKDWK